MKRTHALLISVALAIAVIAGSFAALGSQRLAHTTKPVAGSRQYAGQIRALDRAEAALRAELRKRPPAIPALPVAGATTPKAAPQTVIYRRPAPIVHVIHRHGGEHEVEAAGREGGVDD